MKFFDIFKNQKNEVFANRIQQKIGQKFSHFSEDKMIIIACLSGLMARVAYVDFNVCAKEKDTILGCLKHWLSLSPEEAEVVATIAIEEMTELSGLDSRIYCTPLVELLDVDTRYHILETLFELAASDGSVGNNEANEIQFIANSLVLEKKYFISAQATVKEYLNVLKSNR